MIDPEDVKASGLIKDNLGPEVDSIWPSLRVEGILILHGPVFEVWARVDSESVISSETTCTKAFIDTRAFLWGSDAVLDRTVLIAHRVVPVQALIFPLNDITVVCIHKIAIHIRAAFRVRNLDNFGCSGGSEQHCE